MVWEFSPIKMAISMLVNFLDGNMHGQGTFTYPNGDKRVGVWENGKPVE